MRRAVPAFLLLALVGCAPDARPTGDPVVHSRRDFHRLVILGDRTGATRDDVFERCARRALALRPDAVTTVGDLIEGYQPDRRLAEARAEWDDVLGRLRTWLGGRPLTSAAGNHDIWSDGSERIFRERLGHPPNHAFDLGGARIIIFDTSRVGTADELSPGALAWLAEALAAAHGRAARVVITHRPLWAIEPGGRPGSPFYDVLRTGRVDFVLSGHWHHAVSDDRDGIRFRVLPPSGARPVRPDHPETGSFDGFAVLDVDHRGARLSFDRDGELVRSDIVPLAHNQYEYRLEHEGVGLAGFEIDPTRPPRAGRFEVVVRNVGPTPLVGPVIWRPLVMGLTLTPSRAEVELAPGDERRIPVSYRSARPLPAFGEVIETRVDWPWFDGRRYVARRGYAARFARRVPVRPGSVALDGRLVEGFWRTAAPLGRLVTTEGPPMPAADEVRLVVVGDRLLVGARLHEPNPDPARRRVTQRDGDVFSDDHLWLFLDADPADDHYEQIAVSAAGGLFDRRCTVNGGVVKKEVGWNGSIVAATAAVDGGWTAEVSIPLAELGLPPGGRRIGFNLRRGRWQGEERSRADWQTPFGHDADTFGLLVFDRPPFPSRRFLATPERRVLETASVR